MAGDGDVAVAAHRVDLPLDRVDILDRGEVEVRAPHIRVEAGEEGGAGRAVAGDGARLDHGGALPVLTHVLVIGLGGQHRERQRGRGRIGPEPEVGAEDVAVGGTMLQQADEIAGEPDEEILHRSPALIGDLGRVVENDEVDVARVVELPRAELAHGDDDEPGVVAGPRRIGEYQLAAAGGPGQQVVGGDRQGGVGELAQPSGDRGERPLAGEVGQRHGERQPPPRHPEQRHQGGGIGHCRRRGGKTGQQFVADRVAAFG